MSQAKDKSDGLTIERLKHLLDYSPETGVFTCRAGRGNQMRKGELAGTTDPSGYVFIYLDGYRYRGHRLAWFYTTGEWPSDQIDHINGERSDNRIANLRLASRTENNANSKLRSDNTSGVKGVSWDVQKGKWRAGIRVNKRRLNLGLFSNLENAAAAYEKAAKKYYGEFARPERDTEPGKSLPPVNLRELGILD